MVRDYAALSSFIAGRAAMPFAWGYNANDCVSYAAGAIRSQTGLDALGDLLWADEAEADALIEQLGGLATAVSVRLRSIAPALAQRGDVAGVPRGNELGLMLVEGATLVGPGLHGNVRRPRSDMVMAWAAT